MARPASPRLLRRGPIHAITTEENQNDHCPGEKTARRKLSLLQLAQELGNVSIACQIVGYSRQRFYEIPAQLPVHGAEGLIDRMPGAKGPHPNRVAAEVERAILAHALKHPTQSAQHGGAEKRGIEKSCSGYSFFEPLQQLLRLDTLCGSLRWSWNWQNGGGWTWDRTEKAVASACGGITSRWEGVGGCAVSRPPRPFSR